ncbi:hypothetical protein [Microbacterium imperiale]|uniref:Uncharacterized protein n=1 Tax=Microbacterium imperiale TaxID=33884 RepID=A0A9W6M4N5_9MICO|nr:hypothetical protein [Microbacterium imperiale]MBP2421930.1 hypothetical protein [Microbacterium imperiale]MDS0198970.1 hypothetical protein [Microbacterium imperiale]BFE39236.1 hypothetical protein GCM10017544_01920 [Microbacterium imperiale]GLJ81226.1 hypothetical protein GCM10017586_29090 [Microbacterium imperiale]
MPRRRLAVLTLVLAGALTAGCATAAPVAETPTPTPTPTLDASPTPAPSATADAGPVRAFDADCAQMLTNDQRDAILGSGSITEAEQMAQWNPDAGVVVALDPVGTLGGLECSWYAAEGADLPEGLTTLTTMVVPASAVPAEYAAKYSVPVCEPNYDSSGCRFGRIVGENWVSAYVGFAVYEAPREMLAGVVDTVEQNLATATQPRPDTRTDGVWAIPDCTELGRAIALEELIGPYLHGYWEGSEQPEEVLFAAAGVARSCPLFSDSARVDPASEKFVIMTPQIAPGLGWQWEQLRADAGSAPLPVEVDGAADAFAVDSGHGAYGLFATDGTNVVSVYSEDLELDAQILGRIITTLSS